jgi:hypothetical protein
MVWARQALERNGRLEIVASDEQAKTFTVRVKDSGQLVVVPVDQIVAGTATTIDVPPKQATTTPAVTEPATEAPASPPATTEPSSPPPPSSTPVSSPGSSDTSGGAVVASRGEPVRAPSDGHSAAPANSYADTVSPGEGATPGDAKGPHAQSAANARAGSVLASGPGYSIKASGSKGGPDRASPSTAPSSAPERLHDPIICQGSRLLHIDNRNLEFDGDAITAEDGCEIHITNTHITAKGIGISARAANVHIKNSEIDGDSGAVDASDGAQVYAESSRFKGLNRRLESSAFHDLGGNVWN